jgi:hypothetical protein
MHIRRQKTLPQFEADGWTIHWMSENPANVIVTKNDLMFEMRLNDFGKLKDVTRQTPELIGMFCTNETFPEYNDFPGSYEAIN